MRSDPAGAARARASPATITATPPALITAPNTMAPTAATIAEAATPASAAGSVASAVSAAAALSIAGPGAAFGTDTSSNSIAAPATGMPASALTTDSEMPCAITTGQLAPAMRLPRSRRNRSRGASIRPLDYTVSGRRPVAGAVRHGILQEPARACRRTARSRADARHHVRGPDRDRRSPARRARRPADRRRSPARRRHRRGRPRARRVAARRRRRHPGRPRVRCAPARRPTHHRSAADGRHAGAAGGRAGRLA